MNIKDKAYIRDGRAPVPAKVSTSKAMSANKAKDTTPELLLRKALHQHGLKGFGLTGKKCPGGRILLFLAKG